MPTQNKNAKNVDIVDQDVKPVPEWLFHDGDFQIAWREAVASWERTMASGLKVLQARAMVTKQYAQDWLKENIAIAQTDKHRFEICLAIHMDACLNISLPSHVVTKRMCVYPPLRAMCELEVDIVNSAVKIKSTDALF